MEYLLKATAKQIIWSCISTPMGLSTWFADRVTSDEKTFTFQWGKEEERTAEVVGMRAYSYICFRWSDDPNEDEYFEIRMNNNELTNDYVIEITDFADVNEVDDLKELWNSQMDTLRRTCGF